MVGPSSQWRFAHNYRHHVFTNVIGMDEDLGYGVLRVSRDQEWKSLLPDRAPPLPRSAE
jgi:fatty acid desaturase